MSDRGNSSDREKSYFRRAHSSEQAQQGSPLGLPSSSHERDRGITPSEPLSSSAGGGGGGASSTARDSLNSSRSQTEEPLAGYGNDGSERSRTRQDSVSTVEYSEASPAVPSPSSLPPADTEEPVRDTPTQSPASPATPGSFTAATGMGSPTGTTKSALRRSYSGGLNHQQQQQGHLTAGSEGGAVPASPKKRVSIARDTRQNEEGTKSKSEQQPVSASQDPTPRATENHSSSGGDGSRYSVTGEPSPSNPNNSNNNKDLAVITVTDDTGQTSAPISRNNSAIAGSSRPPKSPAHSHPSSPHQQNRTRTPTPDVAQEGDPHHHPPNGSGVGAMSNASVASSHARDRPSVDGAISVDYTHNYGNRSIAAESSTGNRSFATSGGGGASFAASRRSSFRGNSKDRMMFGRGKSGGGGSFASVHGSSPRERTAEHNHHGSNYSFASAGNSRATSMGQMMPSSYDDEEQDDYFGPSAEAAGSPSMHRSHGLLHVESNMKRISAKIQKLFTVKKDGEQQQDDNDAASPNRPGSDAALMMKPVSRRGLHEGNIGTYSPLEVIVLEHTKGIMLMTLMSIISETLGVLLYVLTQSRYDADLLNAALGSGSDISAGGGDGSTSNSSGSGLLSSFSATASTPAPTTAADISWATHDIGGWVFELKTCLAIIYFVDWFIHTITTKEFFSAYTLLNVPTSFYQIALSIASIVEPETANYYTPNFLRVWVLRKWVMRGFRLGLSLRNKSSTKVVDSKYPIIREIVRQITFMISILVTCAGTYRIIETFHGAVFHNLSQTVYLMVVTFTTVGYGDVIPTTRLSQLGVMLIIFLATATLPNFLAQLEALGTVLMKQRSYDRSTEHVIVVGKVTLKEVMYILRHFVLLSRKRVVVFIRPEPFPDRILRLGVDPVFRRRVQFMVGDAAQKKVLTRAGAERADAIFLLSDKHAKYNRGDITVMKHSLYIKTFEPKLPQYLWLKNDRHHFLLRTSYASVQRQRLTKILGAVALTYPHVIPILVNLLQCIETAKVDRDIFVNPDRGDDWRELYTASRMYLIRELAVAGSLAGMHFKHACLTLQAFYTMMPLALVRSGEVKVNPPSGTVLQRGDSLIVIAVEKSRVDHASRELAKSDKSGDQVEATVGGRTRIVMTEDHSSRLRGQASLADFTSSSTPPPADRTEETNDAGDDAGEVELGELRNTDNNNNNTASGSNFSYSQHQRQESSLASQIFTPFSMVKKKFFEDSTTTYYTSAWQDFNEVPDVPEFETPVSPEQKAAAADPRGWSSPPEKDISSLELPAVFRNNALAPFALDIDPSKQQMLHQETRYANRILFIQESTSIQEADRSPEEEQDQNHRRNKHVGLMITVHRFTPPPITKTWVNKTMKPLLERSSATTSAMSSATATAGGGASLTIDTSLGNGHNYDLLSRRHPPAHCLEEWTSLGGGSESRHEPWSGLRAKGLNQVRAMEAKAIHISCATEGDRAYKDTPLISINSRLCAFAFDNDLEDPPPNVAELFTFTSANKLLPRHRDPSWLKKGEDDYQASLPFMTGSAISTDMFKGLLLQTFYSPNLCKFYEELLGLSPRLSSGEWIERVHQKKDQFVKSRWKQEQQFVKKAEKEHAEKKSAKARAGGNQDQTKKNSSTADSSASDCSSEEDEDTGVPLMVRFGSLSNEIAKYSTYREATKSLIIDCHVIPIAVIRKLPPDDTSSTLSAYPIVNPEPSFPLRDSDVLYFIR